VVSPRFFAVLPSLGFLLLSDDASISHIYSVYFSFFFLMFRPFILFSHPFSTRPCPQASLSHPPSDFATS